MCKNVRQWNLRDDLFVLYLDKPLPKYEPYRNYRINGVIYKPISMSHTGGECIAIQGKGNFVGKEVEFIKEDA